MQSLKRWVLFEELDDGIIARLLPIEDYCNLHDQLQTVTLRAFLRQYEVYIVLLAHPLDQIKKVLFLDLSCFQIFGLASSLHAQLPLPFFFDCVSPTTLNTF